MAVKAGYKQTEVGVIPEDWKVIKLGDWAAFKTGPFGTALHKSDYTNDGIPVINPMHIIDGYLVPTKSMTITEEAAKKLSDFRLKRRDIVIGRRGDMGRCAVIQENQAGWLCGSGSMIIRCAENLGPEFLQRVLSSPRVVAAIEDTSVGSTMTNLNQSVLANLKIQFPPTKAEQQAIAEALSDVDGLISALDTLIAKKRAIKQGAMQELLTGQRRLPGFAGEWAVKMLGELGNKFLNGGTPSTQQEEYWQGDIPWITGADVVNQQVSEVRKFITEEAVKNSATNVVEKGNLLIVTRTGVGKLAIAPFDLAISQDLTGIYVKSELAIPEYLYRFFDYNSEKLKNLNQGTSIAGITRETLIAMKVSLPPLAEQTAIAQLLADMDGELAALAAKRAKTVAVKAGMMQTLLTGQVRLV